MTAHDDRRKAILTAYRVLNGNTGNGTGGLLTVARWIYYGDTYEDFRAAKAGSNVDHNGLVKA